MYVCLPLVKPAQLCYSPFSESTRVSQCQKKASSGLHGAREDNRGRHTDNPGGCHSIRTNQQSTSIDHPFYAGCPSCRNPPNLSWLGTGTGICWITYPRGLLCLPHVKTSWNFLYVLTMTVAWSSFDDSWIHYCTSAFADCWLTCHPSWRWMHSSAAGAVQTLCIVCLQWTSAFTATRGDGGPGL